MNEQQIEMLKEAAKAAAQLSHQLHILAESTLSNPDTATYDSDDYWLFAAVAGNMGNVAGEVQVLAELTQ